MSCDCMYMHADVTKVYCIYSIMKVTVDLFFNKQCILQVK